MTTGKEAQMYADHYIAFHLSAIGGGKVYSELSAQEISLKAEAAADPTNAALAAQVVALDNTVGTVFKGESLRGMLLNAYAFWQLGQIAMISSWVSFLGGLIFLILALLGFAHSRRTSEDDAI
jgi:type VI protein secretion system component VasF